MQHTTANCNALQHVATHCNDNSSTVCIAFLMSHMSMSYVTHLFETHGKKGRVIIHLKRMKDDNSSMLVNIAFFHIFRWMFGTTTLPSFDGFQMNLWHDLFTYVRLLFHKCVLTYACVCHDLWIHVQSLTHSYVRHDSFICVTWLIQMCDMTHSYMWHDSFICVTWLIHTWDVTHSHLLHDPFPCLTWLIHTCVTWLNHVCGVSAYSSHSEFICMT